MQNRISIMATVAILVMASIHAADARAVRSSAQTTGCSAGAISSELRDGHGSCMYPSAVFERGGRGAARVSRIRRATARDARAARSRALHVASRAANCGGRLSAVRTNSGAIACVASSAAGAFQGFVSALEATGYRIDFMGGWRAHGSCRLCNMHPRGLAIDINQTGRNRVTHRFPAGTTELAARYGLLHGAVWDHPDTGHFELLSESPTRYTYEARLSAYASADHASRRGARRRTAALTTVHAVTFTNGVATQGSGYR